MISGSFYKKKVKTSLPLKQFKSYWLEVLYPRGFFIPFPFLGHLYIQVLCKQSNQVGTEGIPHGKEVGVGI